MTNICTGSSQHVASIVDKGVIPLFINLLKSKSEDITDQAIWGLGNIAGESAEYRDLIIETHAIELLINVISSTDSLDRIKPAVWALGNICRTRPTPPTKDIINTLPIFIFIIEQYNEKDLLMDAIWSLQHLTDDMEDD